MNTNMNAALNGQLTRKQRTQNKGRKLRARRIIRNVNQSRVRQQQTRKNLVANRRNAPAYHGLSQCAADYLKSLEDPFSGKVACVPSEFNFPSLKHSVTAYGTFTTGTLGVGFVSVQPFQIAFNGIPSTGSPGPVNYSTAIFTGTTFSPAATTGVGEAQTDTPYTSVLTSAQIETRLVSCGLRVRNVTPMLNRGGSLVGIEELNHQSLQVNGFNLSISMMEDTAAAMSATSDDWQSVTYHPQSPTEISWYTGFTAYGVVPTNYDFMGFIAQAPPSTPQTYEWQVTGCFEAKGTSVQGLTPSHSDPAGFAAVQNAVSSVEARKPHSGDRIVRYAKLAGRVASLAMSAYQSFTAAANPVPMITDA